jgi:TIR domain
MAKVFISYRSLNRAFAQELAISLEGYGHQLAGDLRGLGVSPDYDITLSKDLTASDVIVFLFTEEASGSESILAEVGAAKILYELLKRPHMVPIVFPGGRLPEPISRVWAQVLLSQPSAQELGARVNTLIAGLSLEPTSALTEPFPGDKVTLLWLYDHVPVSYWISLAAVLISLVGGAFTLGIRAGQTIPWLPGFAGVKAAVSANSSTK